MSNKTDEHKDAVRILNRFYPPENIHLVGQKEIDDYMRRQMVRGEPGALKRGGTIRKTGMALVHKGERVLTKRQARKIGRSRGRSGGR